MLEKSNFKYNKQVGEPYSIINGHARHETAKMRFGLRSFASAGGGIIAVYNLMILLNRAVLLHETAREIYIKSKTPLGIFGVHPLRIFRYFSSHYLPVNLDRDYRSFCEKFEPGFCGIVFRWTGKKFFSPIHAFAIESYKGKIYVYNRIPNSPRRYEYHSVAAVADPKSFIVGYYINRDEYDKF
ncbi:MAG: hypothetical protein IJ261_05495 [Clostridia bacterium]|nr:hypothetical protein [Clostridia bacterium]